MQILGITLLLAAAVLCGAVGGLVAAYVWRDEAEVGLLALRNLVVQNDLTVGNDADVGGSVTAAGGITLDASLTAQEESADPSTPASGYRAIYPKTTGGLHTKDDGGYEHALAFAGGNVAAQINEPRPASWQHKDTATGSAYGDLRIEWGRDTLATGTKAITFQQAFSGLLEVFLIDKTAAQAMYPGALGTTGFTANGTGSDTFGWLAIGYDGR